MNYLVMYMIKGEYNIIIDTDASINKEVCDMNYPVKYMIKGEYNIVIDTETSMNKVDDDMNYQVKYKIKGEANIVIDTETCDGVGLYQIRPSRPSYYFVPWLGFFYSYWLFCIFYFVLLYICLRQLLLPGGDDSGGDKVSEVSQSWPTEA